MAIDFKITRFRLLLQKFIRENRKAYFLYAAGLFGVLLLIYGLLVFTSLHNIFPRDLQQAFFVIGLLFGGSFFSASFYSFFSNTSKGIQFLQLPVSSEEKLLLSFLLTQFVFFVSFMLIFLGTDWMLCSFYNRFAAMPAWASPMQKPLFTANRIDLGDPKNQLAILAFFLMSTIAHFGSLAFTKHAFVKTAIAFIIGWVALALYNQYSMFALVPIEIMPHGMFFNDSFRIDAAKNIGGLVILPTHWVIYMYFILPILIYVSFWTGSYFKLKEKQV
jgi:hypothetical protein